MEIDASVIVEAGEVLGTCIRQNGCALGRGFATIHYSVPILLALWRDVSFPFRRHFSLDRRLCRSGSDEVAKFTSLPDYCEQRGETGITRLSVFKSSRASKGLSGRDRVGRLKREVHLHDPPTALIDLGDD